jgi:RNA polymerase sigma-70 factor (ECF subfamily)
MRNETPGTYIPPLRRGPAYYSTGEGSIFHSRRDPQVNLLLPTPAQNTPRGSKRRSIRLPESVRNSGGIRLNRQVNDREKQFQEIFSDYGNKIYRLCCGYVESSEDRHDLHQEILLKIWKNLDSFNGTSSPGTWVYRLAVNTSIDFVRAVRTHRRALTPKSVEDLNPPDASQNVERDAMAEAQTRLLFALLRRLSFVDRTILSLHLDQVRNKGIADILGMTEDNVGVRIHRAKRRLKRMYEELE